MFAFEASVFILFLGFVCIWSLVRDSVADHKYQRDADQVSNVVNSFYGKPIADAKTLFGPPMEEVSAHSGSFYVWKSPQAPGFPHLERAVIVTLTTDERGLVRDGEWHRW